MGNENAIAEADADWENRILCSDGRCTGVIGPDGRCRECGATYGGSSGQETPQASHATDVPAVANAVQATEGSAPGAEAAEAEWDDRVLCRDGSCIGVVGPDGRCRECGLPLKE